MRLSYTLSTIFVLLLATLSCGIDEKRRALKKGQDKIEVTPPQKGDADGKTIKPVDPNSKKEEVETSGPEDYAFAAMNRYCRSCHGVGDLRFFYHEDADSFFQDFATRLNPATGNSWLSSSIFLLTWEQDKMPSLDEERVGDADWMPRGAKRILIDQEQIEGQPAREYLLNYLRTL